MRELTLTIEQIAAGAGFGPGADGKLNLPATQAVADALAASATEIIGTWQIGDASTVVTLTGAGPVWGYLAIAHALHGRCAKCIYASPNATITVWAHGV